MNGDASSSGPLVSTPPAARALGISARTLQRYAAAGFVTAEVTLPSGQYRWNVAALAARVAALAHASAGEPPAR